MSLTFAMRGNKSKQYYAGYSDNALTISGCWYCSGPQPVDDVGGVPKWVDELFEHMPDLETVAPGRKDRGVVFSRIKKKEDNNESGKQDSDSAVPAPDGLRLEPDGTGGDGEGVPHHNQGD